MIIEFTRDEIDLLVEGIEQRIEDMEDDGDPCFEPALDIAHAAYHKLLDAQIAMAKEAP